MQKKHFRILVAAACLCAGLSFSAYGEETISSVPLSFSWDGAPKGGEAVGTLTATTTSQSFIVEGSEYLKDDDTWDYGEWPCAEIELSAAEGYRFSTPNRRTFSLSGCNVQYKSSEIDSDGSTLILQVYLSRIGGQLPKITDLSWSGKNAVWDNIEGCDGYEVCLKKDGKTLVTVTSKGTSYDFSDYINNAGSYVFTVRAVSTYGSQNSSWSAGSEPYILSVEDAWYSDNGNWKKTGNKWRFVYKDESYPACSWREINEKWYYFDGNGYMVTSCYVKALGENLYYWISEDGVWDENETTATPNRQGIWFIDLLLFCKIQVDLVSDPVNILYFWKKQPPRNICSLVAAFPNFLGSQYLFQFQSCTFHIFPNILSEILVSKHFQPIKY